MSRWVTKRSGDALFAIVCLVRGHRWQQRRLGEQGCITCQRVRVLRESEAGDGDGDGERESP